MPAERPLDAIRMTAAIVDVATTGLTDGDELIELAIILVRISRWSGGILEVLEEYRGLRQPTCRIDPGAQAVHGYTKRHLRGHRLDDEAVQRILAATDTLIAHNTAFDRYFLSRCYSEALRKRWLCTMRRISWRKHGFPSRKLFDLLAKEKIQRAKAHHALDDARGMVELLGRRPEPGAPTYLEELLFSMPIPLDEKPRLRSRDGDRSGHRDGYTVDMKVPRRSGCGPAFWCILIALVALLLFGPVFCV